MCNFGENSSSAPMSIKHLFWQLIPEHPFFALSQLPYSAIINHAASQWCDYQSWLSTYFYSELTNHSGVDERSRRIPEKENTSRPEHSSQVSVTAIQRGQITVTRSGTMPETFYSHYKAQHNTVHVSYNGIKSDLIMFIRESDSGVAHMQ